MTTVLTLGVAIVGLVVAALLVWWLPDAVVRRRAAAAGVRFTATLADVARTSTLGLDADVLTDGELKVHSVSPLDPDHERNLRWFAGALSHAADDSVGRALSRLAGRGRLSQVEQRPGLGISGSVDRHPVRIGSPAWLGLAGTGPTDTLADTDQLTTVAVEVDGKALGRIHLVEVPRDDVAEGLVQLRRLGVEPLVVPGRRPRLSAHLAEQIEVPVGSGSAIANADGLSTGALLDDPSVLSAAAAISLARSGLAWRTTGRLLGAALALATLVVCALLLR